MTMKWDEADAPSEVEADSPCTQDESLTSRPKAGLTTMTKGEVTNKSAKARPTPMTRGGVTIGTIRPETSMQTDPLPRSRAGVTNMPPTKMYQ